MTSPEHLARQRYGNLWEAFSAAQQREELDYITTIQADMLAFAAACCRQRAAVYSAPYPKDQFTDQAECFELFRKEAVAGLPALTPDERRRIHGGPVEEK